MLNFTDQLRRLKVDYFEYVSMKVIVLLTSGKDSAEGHACYFRMEVLESRLTDATGLKEPEQVRDSQEKVVQSLQQYTTNNYSTMPSKFGELLLRIPELQRVCQVGAARTRILIWMNVQSRLPLGGKGDAVPASTDWRTRGIQPADGTPTRGPLKLVAGSCTQT